MERLRVETTLNLIVQSATRVVPGASAVIYTYDSAREQFIEKSRVSAGGKDQPNSGDEPRPDGLGMRAIVQRRRVFRTKKKISRFILSGRKPARRSWGAFL